MSGPDQDLRADLVQAIEEALAAPHSMYAPADAAIDVFRRRMAALVGKSAYSDRYGDKWISPTDVSALLGDPQ